MIRRDFAKYIKRGFTLVELLAVIVILAIIALIATPIILGIIEDAREGAKERTVDLVENAVELAYQTRYALNKGTQPTKAEVIEQLRDNGIDNVKDISTSGVIETEDGITCTLDTDSDGYLTMSCVDKKGKTFANTLSIELINS